MTYPRYRVAHPATPNGRRFAGHVVEVVLSRPAEGYVLTAVEGIPGAMTVEFEVGELEPLQTPPEAT